MELIHREGLIADLRKAHPSVEPVSGMKLEAAPQHRSEEGSSILLRVQKVEWIDASHVVVDVAHVVGNNGGEGWRLTLMKEGVRGK